MFRHFTKSVTLFSFQYFSFFLIKIAQKLIATSFIKFHYKLNFITMALWIILGIIALLIIWAIAMYNGLVKAKIKIDNSWSDISVFLKKRYDLIPNLVNTVKGYAAHESQTLEKVVQARNAAAAVPSGDVQGMAQANQVLGGALRGLLAVAENYPDLKANQNFLELQEALQNIETDLGNARRYYNATVRDYNTSIQQFPGVIIANMAGFKAREFFELENQEEARNVEVKF
jgi:LemA protein